MDLHTLEAAKAALVEALAHQRVQTLRSQSSDEWLMEIATKGLKGLASLNISELLQAAADSGLDRQVPHLVQPLLALQAAQPSNVCRTVMQFEVLHPADQPVDDMGLSMLAYECGDGAFVGGNLEVVSSSVLNAPEMDLCAQRLGSDGSFFADEESGEAEEDTGVASGARMQYPG